MCCELASKASSRTAFIVHRGSLICVQRMKGTTIVYAYVYIEYFLRYGHMYTRKQ
jgi:hypothetical protein